MKYVKTPNLPNNKVKIAIIDNRAEEEIQALKKLSVDVIPSLSINYLDSAISSHPDMQICHIDSNSFYTLDVVEKYYEEQITKLAEGVLCETFNNTYISANKSIKGKLEYPEDCLLNCAVSDKWAIAHKKNPLFKNSNKSFIGVNQGYAKCSTCIVTENAIITADKGIAESSQNFGIDVCIVSNNSIRLDGYDNGFIGGCCGKISSDKLVFFGDVNTHPDCDKIISFCKNHGVECISLTQGNLKDYGSLIPIIEE